MGIDSTAYGRRNASRARARGTSGVGAMLAVGGFLLLMIHMAPPTAGTAVPVAELATVALSDDDGAAALFSSAQLLTPGPVTRCLRISYSGPTGLGEVRLTAATHSGALAGDLGIRVDHGTGGGFASCAGFTKTGTVFDGTLTELAATSGWALPGVATGWQPAASSSRTYRITATVPDDDQVQGRAAAAAFQWILVTAPEQSGSPAPAPEPGGTPAPAPQPGGAPAPSPAPAGPSGPAPGTTGPSATPPAPTGQPAVPTLTPAPSTPPDGDERAPGAGIRAQRGQDPPDGVVGRTAGAVADMVGRAARAVAGAASATVEITIILAVRTARHGQYPVASLLALTLFLIAQGRFDKRDPKLALAPVARDPYLAFPPEPDDGGESR